MYQELDLIDYNPFIFVSGAVNAYETIPGSNCQLASGLLSCRDACNKGIEHADSANMELHAKYLFWLWEITKYRSKLTDKTHPLHHQLLAIIDEKNVPEHLSMWKNLSISVQAEFDFLTFPQAQMRGSSLVN